MIFELDARCFFQAHRQLLPQLVRQVVGSWQGDLACDLYAGVGLFSVPLAESYDRVIAVEGDAVSGRFLKRNARKNRRSNLELVPSAVESWIRGLPEGTDRVVVDPPRTGLSRQTCAVLRDRSPRRLTYVSCHAAALARDLKLLAPKYGIESLTLIDLFPQTGHMEVVVQLVSR
jgi:23S rRNA (uracil1939-C5)-methyltransferase